MSRNVARSEFSDHDRIRLVEGDLDRFDDELGITNDKLSKILWVLVGMLISLSTACVLLVVNLTVTP